MKRTIIFRNGQQVCPLGQGTYQMGRRPGEEIQALRRGIDLGLTLIDTAEMYDTEELVGEAVRYCRDRAFIVSKVLPGNASYEGTKRACERSLRRLGTDYIDEFAKPKITWKRVGSIIRFSYDDKGLLGLDSTCFATGCHIPFLCCVLNSSMGHYLLSNAPRTGTGDLLISVQAVEPVKIPLLLTMKNYLKRSSKSKVVTQLPNLMQR